MRGHFHYRNTRHVIVMKHMVDGILVQYVSELSKNFVSRIVEIYSNGQILFVLAGFPCAFGGATL